MKAIATALCVLTLAASVPLPAAETPKAAPKAASAPVADCKPTPETDCMARIDEQMKAMDEMHQKMMQAQSPDERRGMMRRQMGMMRHMMRMMNDQMHQMHEMPPAAAKPDQPKPAPAK